MIADAQSSPLLQATAVKAGTSTTSEVRFTLDGDKNLEDHLNVACARVLSGVRGLIPWRKLEAVCLGGGYGRGEGGVLRHEGKTPDRAYNDLEFYVAIHGNRHFNEFLYQQRLRVLGEILTHLVGIEVEFKITSLAELAHRPISMFSYDLAVGHRLLWPSDAARVAESYAHHRQAETIPRDEATRLLMNRCSGLFFARQHLHRQPFTPASADFVRRNIAKVQLAMGDALLTFHGFYHWSCVERHRRLEGGFSGESIPDFSEILRHHAAGVAFKLYPESRVHSHQALVELHAEVTERALHCWLWIESRRLGRPFATAKSYALERSDLMPGTSLPRNLLLNLRINGPFAWLHLFPWRHPRQKVFRTLALLLWEPSALNDKRLKQVVANNLATTPIDFDQALSAFTELWARVS
jgi:hypothetical protein